MFASRKLREVVEVLLAEWFGYGVLFIEPFAKVNQPTAFRTERTEVARKPITALLANGALDVGQLAHCVSDAMALKSATTLAEFSAVTPAAWRIFGMSSKMARCCAGARCELLETARRY